MYNQLLSLLILFRLKLYSFFPKRRDAIFNLLDALSSYGQHCKSVVELSESEKFERKYSSVTDAIADGLPFARWDAIEKHVYSFTNSRSNSSIRRFVVDCTSNKRAFASKLADRTINHSPNPSPGNKPIAVGHQYSVVATLPNEDHDKDKRWVIPLSATRVKSNEKGNEVGMRQIVNCLIKFDLEGELCLCVGDSLYGSNKCREIASDADNLVNIFRFNINRNLYFPPKINTQQSSEIRKKCGRKKEFGDKFNINKITSNTPCDEECNFDWSNSKGKKYYIKIKCWRDLLLRGSRTFRSSEHPINLIHVTVVDENNKKIFKHPLCLGVGGKKRHDISILDCYNNYKQRYDIEHFFRFGKQRLLMNSFQTSEVEHEELWWKFSILAYTQLYLSRNIASTCPRDWERYLPENFNNDGEVISPSQTQRSFINILNSIGTPARESIPRGNPIGRKKGEIQPKKEKQPIIFKQKKPRKQGEKSIFSGSEGKRKNSERQKIENLVKVIHKELDEINFSMDNFIEILSNQQNSSRINV